MKKIFSTLCMALTAAAMMAQAPVITFEKDTIDLGKINEADGRVSAVFHFKNEGMTPLVLSQVKASCGCTTPDWTRTPVEPGQSGVVTATYNPNNRPGFFTKTITITSNATTPTKKVVIKGEVIPKQHQPSNKFTVSVGALNMKGKTLSLGTIKKGESRTMELEYTNLTQEAHQVELATNAADAFLSSQTTLSPVKPNEVGKFIFMIDTKQAKQYGPVEVYAYVVVDGKKAINDTYKITITADIEEDFANLTPEQRMEAPILETETNVNLGKVAAGSTLKAQLHIKNAGASPLLVHRAYSSDKQIVVKPCKSVKSGKKGTIALEINNAGRQAGKYSREIVIMTNDYKQPRKKVTVNWTVE